MIILTLSVNVFNVWTRVFSEFVDFDYSMKNQLGQKSKNTKMVLFPKIFLQTKLFLLKNCQIYRFCNNTLSDIFQKYTFFEKTKFYFICINLKFLKIKI